jgi:uncharacterized protein YicC (UPF0701 family)
MASIDNVFEEVLLLSRMLWRGPSTSRGVVLQGLVPETLRQVTGLGAGIQDIEKQVAETGRLLNAINEQTLGRIETEIKDGRDFLNAVNEQTLGRIETDIKDVPESLATVRQEVADVNAKLDGLKVDIEQELMRLHAHLDAIKKDIASLPQKP